MQLSPELIYEAALDDDLFAELPMIIAASLDARSCVLHWRDRPGTAVVAAHSRYFSDGQMADYVAHFAEQDLWTAAGMRAGRANRAWKTSDLVAQDDYESSVFYNEWIRGMGDDTFYCCGSVMETRAGHGIIGLHRGRTQRDFSAATIATLDKHVDHLRRMFSLRGKMAEIEQRGDTLATIFDNSADAAVLLDAGGQLVLANARANALLERGLYLTCRAGKVAPEVRQVEAPFDAAVAEAGAAGSPRATTCLLRSRDGAARVATLVPVVGRFGPARILLTISRVQEFLLPETLSRHLRDLFGLTDAESAIALALADGDSLEAISNRRRSTIGTVRAQAKQLMWKMAARRQGEVVQIVNRLAAGMAVSVRHEIW